MTRTTRGRNAPAPASADPSPIPDPELPLASAEAEAAVLASLLLDPALLPAVNQLLPDPRMFHFAGYRELYEAFLSLDSTGVQADHITLPEECANMFGSDPGEVRAVMADLVDAVSTPDNAKFHAAMVRELSDRRESYGIVRGALEQIAKRGTPFREKLALAISNLAERVRPPADDAPLLRTLLTAMDEIDALWTKGETITGLPTGLPELDALTHGLQPEHLVVVAGRPAGGKTQFLLHLVRQAATLEDGPWPSLVDSLEMTRNQLVKRLLKAEAGLDWWDPQAPLPGMGSRAYTQASSVISQWPLEIEQDCHTVPQLRLRVELFRRRHPHGPALVGVDYLSHLRLDYAAGGERRDAMIGEQITRPLKRLAQDYGVCVVLLCQINRAGAREPTRKTDGNGQPMALPQPRLTDLKDSGDIEQDADQVVFLHPLGPGGTHRPDGKMSVGLEKNRHGRSGWSLARFDGALGRYHEWKSWESSHSRYPAGVGADR